MKTTTGFVVASTLSVALIAGGAACGGSSKKEPATQGQASQPDSSKGPAASASASGGVAPATSEESARGIKAFQGGDIPTAKTHFEAAVKKNPQDADALYYLGLVADQTGDKKAAEENYLAALKQRPDLDNAAVNLGALYIEGERINEALLVTRQGLQKNAKHPGLHLNLAVALAMKGDVGGSTRAFDEATRLAPEDPVFQVTYAHWMIVWKRNEEAQAKLRAARPLAENNVDTLGAIAKEMRLAGSAIDCVPTLDKAIVIKDTPELRYERGLCKVALRDEPGSLLDFQLAVAKAPNHADPHYWLAGRYAVLERWKDVIAEYEAYLRLAPSGPFARQAQERIELAKQKTGGAVAAGKKEPAKVAPVKATTRKGAPAKSAPPKK
ncbi:tetratricopeptide repeat protein [Pendulispora albinea]|uniref:Tetratricopeptide repeat protein n=1 Tax=Pendulispora albinea TaxID=2741071 RepID=A0ABZ2LK77_9BACT